MERAPQELLAAMPPMVQRLAVEMSIGNHTPCGRSTLFSWSSTTPGSTLARIPSRSISRMRFRCAEVSTTSASLIVCPAWLVPPPRAVTGNPSSRAMASAASMSATDFGRTTPIGST
jgi:hypothetical protein